MGYNCKQNNSGQLTEREEEKEGKARQGYNCKQNNSGQLTEREKEKEGKARDKSRSRKEQQSKISYTSSNKIHLIKICLILGSNK